MDDKYMIDTGYESLHLTVTWVPAGEGYETELWLDAEGPNDSFEIQLTNKSRKQLLKALKKR